MTKTFYNSRSWIVGSLATISLVGVSLYYLFDHGIIWFVYPDRDTYPVRGIDVSHHQGLIDWVAVAKDDVQFAFIKATEADDWQDENFEENWNNARANHLLVGAYHYYDPRYSPASQSQNFIRTVPRVADALPPVVDVEFTTDQPREKIQQDLQIFLDQLQTYYGSTPIIYTMYDYYDKYLGPEFDNPIWIRDLFHEPKDKIDNWMYWQYKNRGHIDGINGYVDLNVLRSGSNKSL